VNKTVSIVAWALAAAVLTACADDPDKLIASARTSLQQHETQTAIIQLKNALQQRSDSPEARFLLGSALLASGDAVAAAVELKKARDLKHPDVQVLPVLARALLRQGEAKAVVDGFATTTLSDPAAQADLQTSVASAYAQLGNRHASESALKTALAADGDHAPARVLQARMQANSGQYDDALATLDAVLTRTPSDLEALQLQAEVLHRGKGDADGALAAYRKALAIQGDFVGAHSGIMMIHLARKDTAAMAEQLAAMKKALPKHPATQYFDAVVAFDNDDFKTAGELVAQLLKNAPEDHNLLSLAGSVEYRKGNLLQAETHLLKVLAAAPTHRQTRWVLGQIYTRTGQTSKTLEMIGPLLEGEPADIVALSLAAQAHLQSGEMEKAEALFARAAKLNPDDPKAGIALALTRMSRGEVEGGFDDLQRIAAADAGTAADLALIAAHLRRREFAKALEAIDNMDRKQPGQAMTEQMRGTAQVGLGQADAARASFERAVKIDPVYFPAIAGLAALDVAQNKARDAEKHFDALLAQQPSHLQALLAVAKLRKSNGASDEEVAALLNNAVKLNPAAAAPRLQLIEHHLAAGQTGPALVAAQEAVARMPSDLQMLDALGRAQALSGETNQAISTFNKIASAQPKLPLPHMRLADIYIAAKNSREARLSLERALALVPDLLAAQVKLINLKLTEGRSVDALAIARTVQRQRPKDSAGFVLEGDTHAADKKWEAAIKAYRAAITLSPGATAEAMKVHTALRRSGKRAEADRWADSWLRDHTRDAAFLAYLGEGAIGERDFDTAQRQYVRLLELQPNNLLALNNLAWVMVENKQPGALAYAEKANALKPDQPALMDTLAGALAAHEQLPKALEVQRRVVELAPQGHDFRLRLAKLYLQAGEGDKARVELDRLAKLGDKFHGQAEVSRLLGSM